MILGITGGVGTGKSTVLEYLHDKYGAYLIRLDDVARDLQEPREECYGPMKELFGNAGVVREDGTFDRSRIADLVYADYRLRLDLNSIVHPAVKRRTLDLIHSHRDESLIVIEAALLLEDHYDEICDEIWFIFAQQSVRRERLKKSRGYPDEKITGMFASQRSDESYCEMCRVTIDNSSENIQNTYRQIDEAIRALGMSS